MSRISSRTKCLTAASVLGLIFMTFGHSAYAQGADVISFDEALAKALQFSSRLESSSSTVKASKAEYRQARAWQNPVLTLEAENFGGSGPYKGYSGAETTLGVSQLVELSGKTNQRANIAQAGVEASQLDYDIEAISLISDVRVAYANAVAAQERLTMAREQKNIARKLFDEVSERVRAAREPKIQKAKAEITLSTATFAEQKAVRELSHAKHVLASLWNGHEGEYDLQTDYFFSVTPPMDEQEAEQALKGGIYLKRMTAEESLMQATYRLEKAQAVPDPTVSLGFRDFRNTNDRALVASIAIPLPVLNRNSGSIERARENISKAKSEKQSVYLSLINELHEALEKMTNSYDSIHNIEVSLLPAAEKAFALSRKSYTSGKFPYIEVLDAQRTLFDVKEQYISDLNEYHQAKAIVEQLTSTEAQMQTQKGNQQ